MRGPGRGSISGCCAPGRPAQRWRSRPHRAGSPLRLSPQGLRPGRRAGALVILPYPNLALPQAGAPLGPLLVLERLERVGLVRLSRKASLLGAAGGLPRALADIAPGLVAPGYVASVTPDAVFVRFLGGLTGRAGAARAAPPRACAPRAPRPASNPVTGRW